MGDGRVIAPIHDRPAGGLTVTHDERGRFDEQVGPFRRELLAHAYQMLGSGHDAEDAVQQALVRAWRAWDRYDPARASVRTWLHAIASNTCRDALASRARRVLPSGLGAPGTDVEQPLVPATEVAWVSPLPTAALDDGHDDPAAVIVRRGQVRLAVIVALQALPARQRAVLILRDVLRFSAAEVADMIGTTTVAVNSTLQRARTAVGGIDHDEPESRSRDAASQGLLQRYTSAFERADLAELRSLLVADAVMEMPPVPLWFRGRDDVVGFLARAYRMRGTDWRVALVGANGQPAFAAYVRDGDAWTAHSIQVLDTDADGITRNDVFFDQNLFEAFGLPLTWDDPWDGTPEEPTPL